MYSKAQTVKINFPYKGKSIAHCFDFLQLILSFGFISSVWIAWHSRGLWEDFFSLESQNQVCLLLEISWRLVLSSFQVEITFFLKRWLILVKKALYLSVNVFSTKVLIGDTISLSPAGDGTAILRGNQIEPRKAGCKENHFYSLPFGQAEASIY